jgi:hypothetical protein
LITYYYRFYPIVFHSFSDAVISVGEIKKTLGDEGKLYGIGQDSNCLVFFVSIKVGEKFNKLEKELFFHENFRPSIIQTKASIVSENYDKSFQLIDTFIYPQFDTKEESQEERIAVWDILKSLSNKN